MPARRLLDFREQVLKRFQPNEDTPQWCTNWLLRAVICRHEGQQDEHSEWASKAERLAARNSWAKIRAEALMRMGEAVYYCGKLKEGLKTVKKARDLSRQSDARWVEGRCCYILGGITRDLGLWHESASDYQLGLDLAKTSGDDELLARCLAGIASVCDWLEQETHDRVGLYRQALEIFQQLGNQIGVGLCLNGLAEVSRKDGRLAEAEDGYRKAVAVFEAVGSTNKFPPTLNLGMVFLARAEYQKARTLFETLNQELERHAERGALPEVGLALCCCAAYDKRWNAWDRLFNDALSLLSGSGLISRDISWLALLAGDLALGSGEMRRAEGAYHVALSQLKAAQNTAEFRAVEQRLTAVNSGTKAD